MSLFHSFKSVREYMTPVLQQSAFLEQGMLTPEEFVKAGDHLIRTCPTWKWESGEPSKRRPYLPADKQFLSTSSVPCHKRVNDLESANYVDEMVGAGEGADDWCAPKLVSLGIINDDDDLAIIGENDNDPADSSEIERDVSSDPTPAKSSNDDEYLDMEDESLALDESAAPMSKAKEEDTIVKSRRYDVSITYDNYYRTPRIWLFGYSENGSPLSPNQIFQDVMQDYAKKTVTVDPHPHLSRQHASIHPCQHANAMLKILEGFSESGQIPTVEQYIFIFLKFIQSVVPTIEYDYTIDVRTNKVEV